MKNITDLTGKTIIVAGASQGIGRAVAVMCSQMGAKVICLARNEEKLKETCSLLEREGAFYCIDFSALHTIEQCVTDIVNEHGVISGMVYCAGVSDNRPFKLQNPDLVMKLLTVNLGGFIELSRVLSKKGRFSQNGMSIVGISSTAAKGKSIAHEAYAASKAGMLGAMNGMVAEIGKKRIRVNCILPAMVRTDMYLDYLQTAGGEEGAANQRLKADQFLGIIEPEAIATLCVYLLSDSAKYITGAAIPVGAGNI